MSAPKNGSDCGCGGSPQREGGCRCGRAGEASGQPGVGPHVRPRFFAGQLLTEEDLQLLERYVVGKNRLRNRHLVGEGVVCGLEVLCHPCGGREVRVRPGYAIDCCGNDIVVPCEERLDIVQAVQALRAEALDGWECGDPCAEGDRADCRGPEARAAARAEGRAEPPEDSEAPRPFTREYTLVLRYHETATDPVRPYATGDTCSGAGAACEPTRVHEGYRLALRCPKGPAPLPDIRRRLLDCLGNFEPMLRALDQLGRPMTPKRAHVYRAQAEAAPLRADSEELIAYVAAQRRHLPSSKKVAAGATERMRDVVGGIYALAKAHPARPTPESAAALARGVEAIDLYRAVVTPKMAEDAQSTPEDRRRAAAACRLCAHASEHLVKVKGDRVAVAAEISGYQGDFSGDAEEAEVIQRVTGGREIGADLQRACALIEEIRRWIMDRLEHRADRTDCELRDLALCVGCPREEALAQAGEAALDRVMEAARLARQVALRMVLDCLCQALLPPCPPCDDLDVPLATVRVRDCAVVSVCNLNRRMVASGPATRYWMPRMERTRQLLHTLCCLFPSKLGRAVDCPDPTAAGLLDGLVGWLLGGATEPWLAPSLAGSPDSEIRDQMDPDRANAVAALFREALACGGGLYPPSGRGG